MPKRKKHAKQARKAPRKKAKSKQLTPGQWFDKLVAVQARLRAPNGCPWDREQTHQSLRTYLIEEAYEVLEALESGNDTKFAEEMGDLLLQIVFHSQIACEEGREQAKGERPSRCRYVEHANVASSTRRSRRSCGVHVIEYRNAGHVKVLASRRSLVDA